MFYFIPLLKELISWTQLVDIILWFNLFVLLQYGKYKRNKFGKTVLKCLQMPSPMFKIALFFSYNAFFVQLRTLVMKHISKTLTFDRPAQAIKLCHWKGSCSVVSDSLQPHGLYSLPGSSIHGIFQSRILEWVAISFSRRSSQPRDWTRVFHIVGRQCKHIYIHTYIHTGWPWLAVVINCFWISVILNYKKTLSQSWLNMVTTVNIWRNIHNQNIGKISNY